MNRTAAAAGRIVGLMAHKVRGQWGVRKGIHFSLSLAAFNAEVEAELHCTLFVSVFCWLFEGSRYQRSPFDWSVLGDTAQADMGCTRTFCKSQIFKALLRSHSKEDHEINVLGCLVNLPMKFLGHNSMNNLDHGMVRVVISTINRYQQVEDLFDQQQSFYSKVTSKAVNLLMSNPDRKYNRTAGGSTSPATGKPDPRHLAEIVLALACVN